MELSSGFAASLLDDGHLDLLDRGLGFDHVVGEGKSVAILPRVVGVVEDFDGDRLGNTGSELDHFLRLRLKKGALLLVALARGSVLLLLTREIGNALLQLFGSELVHPHLGEELLHSGSEALGGCDILSFVSWGTALTTTRTFERLHDLLNELLRASLLLLLRSEVGRLEDVGSVSWRVELALSLLLLGLDIDQLQKVGD